MLIQEQNNMVSFNTYNPILLKECIKHLNKFLGMGYFLNFNTDRINFINICPANVCLLNLNINKSFFNDYKLYCDSKEIFIDTTQQDTLKDILSRFNKNDLLTLNLSDSDLSIVKHNDNLTTFNLKLDNYDLKKPTIPELNFNVIVRFKSLECFNNLIEFIKPYLKSNKFITIKTLNNKLIFDIDNNVLEMETLEFIKYSENIKSCYSLDYFYKFLECYRIGLKENDKTFTLSFSDTYPLRIDLKINDILEYNLILAPKGVY